MSIEFEKMLKKIQLQQVPENWKKLSFLSLKSLQGWFEDLIERILFFQDWMDTDKLKSYWFSSFYFP